MGVKKQTGFTIIEVMLFISVSSLLFVGLVSGMQLMISRARFSDSMVSLKNLIQSQYEEVRTGINSRQQDKVCGTSTTTDPGAGPCLVLGKIIRFSSNSSSVKINYLVSDAISQSDATFIGDTQALKQSNVRIVTTSATTANIQWASTFVKGFSQTIGPDTYSTIAIIRSPISDSVYMYAFPGTIGDNEPNLIAKGKSNESIIMLVKNSGIGAEGGAICIGAGAVSSNVESVAPVSPSIDYTLPANLSVIVERCNNV